MSIAAALHSPPSLMRAKRKGCDDFFKSLTAALTFWSEKISPQRAQRKSLGGENLFHLYGICAFLPPLSEFRALCVLCGEPILTSACVASLQPVCHNEFPEFV